MEPLLVKLVTHWCKLLINGPCTAWSTPQEMSESSYYLVLDVLCDLCFGQFVDTKEPGENDIVRFHKRLARFLTLPYMHTSSSYN